MIIFFKKLFQILILPGITGERMRKRERETSLIIFVSIELRKASGVQFRQECEMMRRITTRTLRAYRKPIIVK